MMRALDDDQCWFGVLPDRDSASGIAEALRMHASQEVPYPSGRPWLIGCWTSDQLVSAEIGTVKLVVIGRSAVTATELHAAIKPVRTTGDVDRLAGGLSGSFHLVAAVGGQVRVQGSVSGFRRVFHTRTAGVTLASDRATSLRAWPGLEWTNDNSQSGCCPRSSLTRSPKRAAGMGYTPSPAARIYYSTPMGRNGWCPGGSHPNQPWRWSRRHRHCVMRYSTQSTPAPAQAAP